ncbi:sensor histidine kinase [Methylococcus geothermalis]|uniref:histidine kinase n=1 Tax=Methylococcus geothermalis TaxID=2681310 RepID=A0A858QBF5_9GAMM|nr:ATP-binding protein [Methylococcus geothermalis]QJD31026.1 HAMP domain-containing protein [Methylococcus geothermalis]
MNVLSFRIRLVLAHLVIIVAVLACGASGAYWMLRHAVHDQLDAALLALAETEKAMLIEAAEQPPRVHETTPGPAPLSFARLDRLVQIIDASGQVLARSLNLGAARLPAPPALLSRLAAGETVFETLPAFGEEPVRMVSMPVQALGSRLAIQVAGSLDDVSNVMKSANLLFVVMTLGLLVAVGLASLSLTRKAFRAIDEVVQRAHRIGEANLGERLPHPGTRDEIGRLVDTLNEMLDRIEQSFEVQRSFTADASHELRSPLSRLRTELEITLRRPRALADYVRTLRSCLEEVERLTRLVEELLVLARIDAGQEHDPIETVSLNALVEEAVRRHQPVARECSVRIVVEPSPEVMVRVAGDSVSLVFSNILDNALKFSPPGGTVTIRFALDGPDAIVSISDHGPGIGTDEPARLFERFYRGAMARAEGMPGTGLGLALSQAIAHRYGGAIDASNLPDGGARFAVRLPAAIQEGRLASET